MPKVRKIPTRMCVACKQMRPKRELVRIVRTPAGEIKIDPTGKQSGRGAYVCPTPTCAEAGLREGRLQHALEAPIPEEAGWELRRAVEAAVAEPSGAGQPKIIRIPAGRRPPGGVTT